MNGLRELARGDAAPAKMIGLAQRDNNSKRGYLLVNRLQAKHVPAQPQRALELFDQLGAVVYPQLEGKTVTFIGFAETATAIGARLAVAFPGKGYYLQTTREALPPELAVVNFEEEHSHATQQQLFCQNADELLRQSDLVLFVEDELTTGQTILNFVAALEQGGYRNRFAVASLLNSMAPGQLQRFRQRGVEVFALFWLDNLFSEFSLAYPVAAQNSPAGGQDLLVRVLPGRVEPRCGLSAATYRKACDRLTEAAAASLPDCRGQRVLVLGTEEFMYPAIHCADYLRQRWQGASVRVHATTRSPILPGDQPDYPLFCRHDLDSIYESGRPTFVYNLERYDMAVVLTDAASINPFGLAQLLGALRSSGTTNVQVIQWAV